MRFFVLAAMAFVLSACDGSKDRTQRAFLPDMFHSVPYDAYDAWPGEMAMRPPEGTVPIGYSRDRYEATEPDAIRAGEELSNPVALTPETLARGRHVFETMCLVCHGPEGQGDGPIIGRFPNPASLLADHARSYPDGRIYHVITYGQGLMPSHAVQIRPMDRWKVVHYVRTLQATASPPSDEGVEP